MKKASDVFTPCWHDQPVAAPLRPGEVHAWLLDLDAPAVLDARLLDGNERERAARFRAEADRRCFIRRRLLARGLVAGLLDVPPASVAWTVSPHGRIAVAAAALDFNWSHSANLFLFVAAAVGRVGADIERWRDDLDVPAVAETALPASEAARLRSLPRTAFWSAWTEHEAVAKACGAGIVEPSAAGLPGCRIASREGRDDGGRWTAAIALQRP
jgi:4'-phosphopantetheinyl transferase